MTGAFSGVARLLPGGWPVAGAALVALPLAFGLGRCTVNTSARCAARTAGHAAETLRTDRAADAQATTTRRTDDQTIAAKSRAIQEATHALPDHAPSARQHARACRLLHQQGAAPDLLRTSGC